MQLYKRPNPWPIKSYRGTSFYIPDTKLGPAFNVQRQLEAYGAPNPTYGKGLLTNTVVPVNENPQQRQGTRAKKNVEV